MADAIQQEEQVPAAATATPQHDGQAPHPQSQPEQENQPEKPAEVSANPLETAAEDVHTANTAPTMSVNDTKAVEEQPVSESSVQQEQQEPDQPASDEQPSSQNNDTRQTDTMQDPLPSAEQTDLSTSNTGEAAAASVDHEKATLSEAQAAALLNVDSTSDPVDQVDTEMQPVDAPNHASSLADSAPTTSAATDEVMQEQATTTAAKGDADMNGHADTPANDSQSKTESADLPPTTDDASGTAAAGDTSMDGSKDQESAPVNAQEDGPASTAEPQSDQQNGRTATSQDPRDTDAGYHAMKIYIGGLPERTERRDLEDCFGQFGEISHIELRLGFAFIEYTTAEGAQGAIEEYDGGHFLGAEIKVEASKSRTTQTKSIIENTCFTCGEHGHYARHCPKDPRNSGKASSGAPELRDSYRAPHNDTIHPNHRDSYRPGGGARDRERSPPPRRRERDDRDRRRDHDDRPPRANVPGIDRYVSAADYDRRGPPPRSRDDRDRDFRDRDRDRAPVRGYPPHSAPGYIDPHSGRGPGRDSRGPGLPPQDMYERDRRDRIDAARDMERRERRQGGLPYYDSGRPPLPSAMNGPPGYLPPGQGYGYTPERGAPAGYGYPPGIPPEIAINMPGRGFPGPVNGPYSAPPPGRGEPNGRSGRRDDAPGYFPGGSGGRDETRSGSGPSPYGLPNAPGYTPYGGSAPGRGPYSASLPPAAMPVDSYGRPMPGPYPDFPARPPGNGYGYPPPNASRPGYDAPPDSRRDSRDRYDRR